MLKTGFAADLPDYGGRPKRLIKLKSVQKEQRILNVVVGDLARNSRIKWTLSESTKPFDEFALPKCCCKTNIMDSFYQIFFLLMIQVTFCPTKQHEILA